VALRSRLRIAWYQGLRAMAAGDPGAARDAFDALAGAQAGGSLPGGRLLGCEFTERSLRFGLERSYRAQARLAPDRPRWIELVHAANAVRPRTWG
jgi:hypothetical protein